tara:strand:- start:221 stop:346 length:126 start_codon:yes stop_codon:yes gene_type:complete
MECREGWSLEWDGSVERDGSVKGWECREGWEGWRVDNEQGE